MKLSRSWRILAVCSSAAVIAGAFVAPAEAKKKLKCLKVTPAAPEEGEQNAEATEAPLVKVTSKATEDKPLVFEYEHGVGVHEPVLGNPIQEDSVYFNFQVLSKGTAGLHLLMEWPSPSPSDIDMYLYDALTGTRVASSGAFNPAPIPGVFDANGNGGQGFEHIPGFQAGPCAAFTVESRAFLTEGESMTLKVWLGDVGSDIPD